jgi:uncharacterized membrane protein
VIIQHFDEHSGRFLQLEIPDDYLRQQREAAQSAERFSIRRTVVMRRCLRLLDAGASPEHALGEAFNAGHTSGSGVAELTQAEIAVLGTLCEITDQALDIASMAHPEAFRRFAAALRDLRKNPSYEF